MRFRYSYHLLVVALVIVASVAACRKDKIEQPPATKEFDRGVVLKTVADNVIMVNLAAFATECNAMVTVLNSFGTTVDAAAVTAAQVQWRKTANAWKKCESFNLGDVRDKYIHYQVHAWPANDVFINQFIDGADVLDEAFIAGKGSSSKGIAAIEYLLFSPNGLQASADSLTTAPSAARRRMYLVATAQNLKTVATEIGNTWSVSGGDYYTKFIKANATGVTSSTNMLINEMVSVFEKTLNTKMGKPMGKQASTPIDTTLEEAFRSGESLALIKSDIAVLQNTFHGGPDTSAVGIDDYLDAMGAKYEDKRLSEKINLQFEVVKTALNNLPAPLSSALRTDLPKVETTFQELKKLLVLFKVDVASGLSITLTLNDNDGD